MEQGLDILRHTPAVLQVDWRQSKAKENKPEKMLAEIISYRIGQKVFAEITKYTDRTKKCLLKSLSYRIGQKVLAEINKLQA